METANAPTNYIYNFYYDIENLSIQTANYINNLLEYKTIYGNVDEESEKKIPEQSKATILQNSREARFWVLRSYTHFIALSEKITIFQENKTLQEMYEKLIITNPLNATELQEYLFEINKLFVKGIAQKELKDALETYGTLNSEWAGGQSNV